MCFHIVGHSPGQVTPMVQQKTDGTDGNDDQEYLLLPHLWEAEGKRDGKWELKQKQRAGGWREREQMEV